MYEEVRVTASYSDADADSDSDSNSDSNWSPKSMACRAAVRRLLLGKGLRLVSTYESTACRAAVRRHCSWLGST